MLMSESVAEKIRTTLQDLPFRHFFEQNPVLVPVPRSALMKPGTLWVPQRLAYAMVQRGLGASVIEFLKRETAVLKSSTAKPAERPRAIDHYHSLSVQGALSDIRNIVLIDDVITRGATLVGAASKLTEAFPHARIRAFAAMRAMSPPDIFLNTLAPCCGWVTVNGDHTFRKP